MKLSEAIRAGAKCWPNHRDYDNGPNGCCAIGAAVRYECVGPNYDTKRYYQLGSVWERAEKLWPALAEKDMKCFIIGCEGQRWALDEPEKEVNSILGIASHLHADHNWSREAVAEWVETMEKKLEPHAPCAEGDQVPSGNAAGDAASVSAPAEPVSVVL